jgi:hypothetical protein
MGGIGTSNALLSDRTDGRYVLDPSDPLIGMPNISCWVKELDRRLRNGDLKGGKKDMEKQ